MDDEWMSRRAAAAYLTSIGCPVSWKTLANKACSKSADKGPAYVVSGWRSIAYSQSELDRYANARRRIVNGSH